MAQGEVGLQFGLLLGHHRPQFPLLEKGVELHLVDGGLHGELGDKGVPDFGGHVAHANGVEFPGGFGLLRGLPGAGDVAVGLVNQIEVDVPQAQFVQGGLNACLGGPIAVVLKPEFAGDENLFPGDAALPHGLPHFGLVEVGGGGVNVAVTDLQGLPDGPVGGAVVGDLKDPEAYGGDDSAVVEYHGIHVKKSPFLSVFRWDQS